MSKNLVKNQESTNLQKPYGYVYKTTNLINGKIYIGQHALQNFDFKYKGSGVILKRAFKKYNKENFQCFPLCWCWTKEELDQKEIEFIKHFDSINPKIGYNRMTGGLSNGHMSKETKSLISQKALNRDEETKTRMAQATSDACSKKVICLQDLKIYNSMSSAAKAYKTTKGAISKIILGNQTFTKDGYSFEIYNSEKSYIKQPLIKEQRHSLKKKIICLQTLEVFDSIHLAALKMNLLDTSVCSVLNNRSKQVKGYSFKYFDSTKTYEKQPLLKQRKLYKKFEIQERKIICNETGEIFKSIKDASQILKISYNNIFRNVTGEIQKTRLGLSFDFYKASINLTPRQNLGRKIICNETGEVFESIKKAEAYFGLGRKVISQILAGKNKKTRSGLSFKYV